MKVYFYILIKIGFIFWWNLVGVCNVLQAAANWYPPQSWVGTVSSELPQYQQLGFIFSICSSVLTYYKNQTEFSWFRFLCLNLKSEMNETRMENESAEREQVGRLGNSEDIIELGVIE